MPTLQLQHVGFGWWVKYQNEETKDKQIDSKVILYIVYIDLLWQ